MSKNETNSSYVIRLDAAGMGDVEQVGGKNASLGEMIQQLTSLGVSVPGGFATTATAYRDFLQYNQLHERIHEHLDRLDIEDVQALAATGKQIRNWIEEGDLQPQLQAAVTTAYQQLQDEAGGKVTVAVRSSATAEDLPHASFAGQQETFLNINGLDNVLTAIKSVFASLFNDRAISYRVHNQFKHRHVALSAGIQLMIRSDTGASGVMFTLDTESGFNEVVFITGAYGLGETVVQGEVNPDEFYVHKKTLMAGKPAIIRRNLGSKLVRMIYDDDPLRRQTVKIEHTPVALQQQFCLTDEDILDLGRQAIIIEKHYQRPMDIEWAKDGINGRIYIVQARPETVKSRDSQQQLKQYILTQSGTVLITGRSIGQRIGSGIVRNINSVKHMDRVQTGDILVTQMTDPDWEPVMKKAAAIITDRGGRTCHAAIIARELGIPAVVGCGDATTVLQEGSPVTVSCAEGDTGKVYAGQLTFSIKHTETQALPKLPTKIMMNVANPDRAFSFAMIPNEGVGLARLEFIINRMIGVHPKALLQYNSLPDELKQLIQQRMYGYPDPVSFYVEKLCEGIATLAAAFSPNKVIVRLSDFKSNEYANLIAGKRYEPEEENPMIGFRGASRYLDPAFGDCFALECRALLKVRNTMGFTNVEVMVPFVRTLDEARQVIALLAENGLERGKDGLRIIMMCEIPSNALLAEQFLEYFDGFSIGSNDLTQLTLGLDRDSALVADKFDERDPAVKVLLQQAISVCNRHGKYIGICGQGPSDYDDFAIWLLKQGIGSISLNPDTVVATWIRLGEIPMQNKIP